MARRPLEQSDNAGAAELYLRLAQPHQFPNDPRRQDVIDIPCDAGMRAEIAQALAYWHDHGPRTRDTRETAMAMLKLEATVDAARQPAITAGPSVDEILAGDRLSAPGRLIDVIDVDAADG